MLEKSKTQLQGKTVSLFCDCYIAFVHQIGKLLMQLLLFQISFSTNFDGDHYEANVAVNLTAMLVIATIFISVSDSYVSLRLIHFHIDLFDLYLGCQELHQLK